MCYESCPFLLAISTNSRSTRYVEQALGWEVSTPSTRYGERVEYSVSTQLPLDTLHAPSSSFDMVRRGLGSTPVEPYDTAAPSAPEKGMSSAHSMQNVDLSLFPKFQRCSLCALDRTCVCSTRTSLPYRRDLLEEGRGRHNPSPPRGWCTVLC